MKKDTRKRALAVLLSAVFALMLFGGFTAVQSSVSAGQESV